MTATVHTTPVAHVQPTRGRYVRAGLVAGVAAAATTLVVAAAADAWGTSLEIKGESIPAYAFAQVTIMATLIGIAIAAVLVRRSSHAARTFTRVSVALTAASMIPPVIVDADVATKAVLVATHLLAAIIVIPAIASRLRR